MERPKNQKVMHDSVTDFSNIILESVTAMAKSYVCFMTDSLLLLDK